MKEAFIIIGVVLFVLSIVFIFGPEIKRNYAFKKHKKRVSKKLYSLAKNYDNFLINDFSIKYKEDIIDFDHVYFGNKYIYCFRSLKSLYGIEGSAKDLKWFDYNKNKQFDYIDNVLKINSSKVSILKKYLNIKDDEKFFYSIICVNDSCDIFIKDLDECEIVINYKDIKKFILSKEKDKSVGTINQNMLENTVKSLYRSIQQDQQDER